MWITPCESDHCIELYPILLCIPLTLIYIHCTISLLRSPFSTTDWISRWHQRDFYLQRFVHRDLDLIELRCSSIHVFVSNLHLWLLSSWRFPFFNFRIGFFSLRSLQSEDLFNGKWSEDRIGRHCLLNRQTNDFSHQGKRSYFYIYLSQLCY